MTLRYTYYTKVYSLFPIVLLYSLSVNLEFWHFCRYIRLRQDSRKHRVEAQQWYLSFDAARKGCVFDFALIEDPLCTFSSYRCRRQWFLYCCASTITGAKTDEMDRGWVLFGTDRTRCPSIRVLFAGKAWQSGRTLYLRSRHFSFSLR